MPAPSPPDSPAPGGHLAPSRSEGQTAAFVTTLSVVMAFGVEALLPGLDLVDAELGFAERDLSVSLVVSTLIIGMGIGQLLWGPLADAIGRRPTLTAGLVVYGLGAFGTAVAPNIELLLVARVVWGIGAAAPNGLRFAVARDLFGGETLARIVTIATAAFFIAPVLMPILGEGLLLLGPWQLIAWAGVPVAIGGALVARAFGETLPAERRRPLRVGPVLEALVVIVRTPASVGAIVAASCTAGAFFVFLGNAQPILDRIYDRDAQFVWFFAASGLTMAATLVGVNRLLRRHPPARMAVVVSVVFTLVSALAAAATLAADGVPSVWLWISLACVANGAGAAVASLAAALALEPLGEVAGTGASALAFMQLTMGGIIAAVIGAFVDTTVTAMFVGATACGVVAVGSLRWSVTARP